MISKGQTRPVGVLLREWRRRRHLSQLGLACEAEISDVLRLTLHPQGLANRIANLTQWRAHLLARLRRQIEVSGDLILADLLKELSSYPVRIDGKYDGSENIDTQE
jgi:hypothetical protein